MKKVLISLSVVITLIFITGCSKDESYNKMVTYLNNSDFSCKQYENNTELDVTGISCSKHINAIEESIVVTKYNDKMSNYYEYKTDDYTMKITNYSNRPDKSKGIELDVWFYNQDRSFVVCEYMPKDKNTKTITWNNGIKTSDVLNNEDKALCNQDNYKKIINEVLDKYEKIYNNADVKLNK